MFAFYGGGGADDDDDDYEKKMMMMTMMMMMMVMMMPIATVRFHLLSTTATEPQHPFFNEKMFIVGSGNCELLSKTLENRSSIVIACFFVLA